MTQYKNPDDLEKTFIEATRSSPPFIRGAHRIRLDKIDDDSLEFITHQGSFKHLATLYAWNERMLLIKKIMELRMQSDSQYKSLNRRTLRFAISS